MTDVDRRARYAQRHPDRVRDSQRRSRQAHPERRIAWRAENRDRLREQNADWYQRVGADRWRQREYGLTRERFDELLEAQGRACAICRVAFGKTKVEAPHVDHDHESNVVRGLLCSRCNFLIGNGRDDPAVLEAAASYLREHKEVI